MPGIEKGINGFTNGLILNQNKLSQKKDSYSYALNAIKENSTINTSNLENEKGFVDIINLNIPFLLLGQIWFGKKQYILFTKNLDNAIFTFNRIYYIDLTSNISIPIKDDINLNFKSTNEIKGTYKINYLNQRVIYFVDGLNQNRSLNIDLSPQSLPIGQLALNPQFSSALIQSTTPNDSGGALVAGAYEFALRYRFQSYNVTNIFGLCLPVYISIPAENTSPVDYGRFNGTASGTLTSKSITLNIVDLDLTYTSIDLLVIKTVAGVSTVSSVDNIIYSGSTALSYTFTGLDQTTPIPQGLSAITVDPANYYGAEVISQKENRLILANLKQDTNLLRYQQYANNVTVSYSIQSLIGQTALASNTQTPTTQDTLYQYCSFDPSKTEYNMTVMRGEVYSLGMSFILNSGVETNVFHIPGRTSRGIPDTLLTNDPIRGGQSQVWKVADTNYTDTNNLQRLSYWESLQQYPSGFDYPIGPIRHHKIPRADIEPLTSYDILTNILYVRYIVLQFNNIQVPAAIKSQIKMIKFHMTPRDLQTNKSIIAKGAFIRTAISGADLTYTGNPHQASPLVNTRYVVAASPFSAIPKDIDPIANATPSRINQMNANYSNVKLNMDSYGYNGNGIAMSNISNISLPSPNTTYNLQPGGTDESKKAFLFFHSPDTDPKIDNNDTPPLTASSIYLENKIEGTVNWFLNTGQNQDTPPRGANAFGRGATPSTVTTPSNLNPIDFKGQCIFTKTTPRVNGLTNSYKVKGATYVPYNSRLSESTLGNISMPYYGQLRESGTIIELDPNSPVFDFSDYTNESSTLFGTNSNQPLYATGTGGDNPGGVGNGSIDGPQGTADWHGKFTGFPTIGVAVANPNNAVYYYGSISAINDSQYGKILGLTYRYLGITVDNLATDVNDIIINNVQGIIGDTFIDMYSVKRTSYFTYAHDAASILGTLGQIFYVGISSFPVESTINFRMRLTKSADGQSFFPKDVYGVSPDTWLDKNFYYDNFLQIDDDYNKKYSKQNYAPIQSNSITANTGLVSTSTQTYQTRIAYSKQSLSEDTIDLWRTFAVNDYRDLPKNRGPVTSLFTKYEQLFALTRDSLFDIYGSNYNIQTTGDQNIAVGTGSFFSTEPREVLSIDGGFAGTSSKMSVVETPYGYLFVDKNKHKVILFSQQMIDITMQGTNDYFKANGTITLYDQIPDLIKASGFDNPVNNIGYTCVYDPDHYRILITKLDYNLVDITRYKGFYQSTINYLPTDIFIQNGILNNISNSLQFNDPTVFINKSFTLSYIPTLQQWESFHSYLPTNYLPSNTGFMAKNNTSNIQLSNTGNMGTYFGTTYPFIIETVFNDHPDYTKVLDSIKVNLHSLQSAGVNSVANNEFFDFVSIYTEFQHSGIIPLVLNSNLTKKEKDWAINKFFDIISNNHSTQLFTDDWSVIQSQYPIDKVLNPTIVGSNKPWYTLGRMRDKYFIIRFIKNNLDNDKFILNFVSSIYRRSIR